MEPNTPESLTPSRSTGLGDHVPPPRNSLEDADSSMKRKRPRLDSGNRVHQDMASQASENLEHPLSPDRSAHEVDSPGDKLQVAQSPPNRMTLNLRDSHQLPQQLSKEHQDPQVSPSSVAVQTNFESSTVLAQSPVLHPADTSFSPCQTDIDPCNAEPSDVENQDHGNVSSDFTERDWYAWQKGLIDNFPASGLSPHDWTNDIRNVWVCLTSNPRSLGNTLRDISKWIDEYLSATQDQRSRWLSLIMAETSFWHNLPKIYEYMPRKEFLNQFERACAIPTFNKAILADAFMSFVRLTIRLVQVDCDMWDRYPSNSGGEANSISTGYLLAVSKTCLLKSESPMRRALERQGFDLSGLGLSILRSFHQEPPSVGIVYTYFDLCFSRVSNVELQHQLLKHCLMAVTDLSILCSRVQAVKHDIYSTLLAAAAIEFFSLALDKVSESVKKQLPVLTAEFLQFIVNALSDVVTFSLATDEKLSGSIASFTSSAILAHDQAESVNVVWKTELFEKCIREGRMEIRISGLDCLQTGLIELYNKYVQGRPAEDLQHPIVKWAGDKLLTSKLVWYLLSVDSHPQIISRCANVIGFLAVSGQWTTDQTERVWDALSQSEDPRVSDSIIEMLPTVIRYLSVPDLTYLVKKLQNISVDGLDLKLQSLLIAVCTCLGQKWQHEMLIDLDPVLAIAKMLRIASTAPNLDTVNRADIWKMGCRCLQGMLLGSWDRAQRMSVYAACLAEMDIKASVSSGSCFLVRYLLDRYGQSDLFELSTTHNIAGVMTRDFARLGPPYDSAEFYDPEFIEPINDRLRILELIILHLSDDLSEQMIETLWSSMVAEGAVSPVTRNLAWMTLARVATQSELPNFFLDHCLSHHLPQLDPVFYSRSILEFAQQVREYERHISETYPNKAGEGASAAGDALYWQLALSAEDDFIATGAAKFLVHHVVQGSEEHLKSHVPQEQKYLVDTLLDRIIESSRRYQTIRQKKHDDKGELEMKLEDFELKKVNGHFFRAFNMLQQFVQAVRTLDPGPPSTRSDSQTSAHSLHGEIVYVRYSTSDRGIQSPARLIEIGDQSPFSELIEILRSRTGFSKFNLIVGGQRLDQEKYCAETIAALKLSEKGPLIMHRIPGSVATRQGQVKSARRNVDVLVMNQFLPLYEILSLNTRHGRAMLEFLLSFQPHEEIMNIVSQGIRPLEPLFPLQMPYKALYSLYAIRHALQSQLEDGRLEESFLKHSVRMMVQTLFTLDLYSSDLAPSMASQVAQSLLPFLKEPVPVALSDEYFFESGAFISNMTRLIEQSERSERSRSFDISQNCLAIMLEASRLNSTIWCHLKEESSIPALVQRLLLYDTEKEGRIRTQQIIQSILATLPSTGESLVSSPKPDFGSETLMTGFEPIDLVRFLWRVLASAIPETRGVANRSQEFFELTLHVFEMLEIDSRETEMLQTYFEEWSLLLIEYKHQEVVGQDRPDWVVKGLGDLLHQDILLLSRFGQVTRNGKDILEKLFTTHLYPAITSPEQRSTPSASPPVLNPETRHSMHRMLIRLAAESENCSKCINLLRDLLVPDSMEDLGINFDRSKYLRAPIGFPGLTNLSNTCYLNSLVAQLFMNLRFREFILQFDTGDGSSYRLIHALKCLFAELQYGWQKSASTQALADAIDTYDGPLDPQIQMDVDEAFNLLFERLEDQLVNSSDKDKFKRIFGGQIVQQIKSKECEHVSERFEPITAVSCDVQGKRGLLDSLNAYIEGEMMEGDNKYKCNTCDKYVNAVKRARLKNVPDSLIFHLKRFDYDLALGTRSKVNDHFEFPERIDMSPYSVQQTVEKDGLRYPDNFILVGILVHNGTAELGHYYSYIREWPTSSSWIEFNDSEVSRFDPRTIPDQCYGGCSESYQSSSYSKSWNAYMLFYQRENSAASEIASAEIWNYPPAPVLKVEATLSSKIASANEVMARIYCVSAAEHVKFVKDLLTVYQRQQGNRCSENHVIEETFLELIWEHVEQIFCRDSKRIGVPDMLELLVFKMSSCLQCCKIAVSWLLKSEDQKLRTLLMRVPDSEIRIKVGDILVRGLQRIKTEDPHAYGLYADPDGQFGESQSQGYFALMAQKMRSLQLLSHANSRSWVDFYDLLCSLVTGSRERAVMHELGFLQHCLEILLIDSSHDWTSKFQNKHNFYLRNFERRSYNLSGLVRLTALLLSQGSVTGDPHFDAGETESVHLLEYKLSVEEIELLSIRRIPDERERKVAWILERTAASDYPQRTHYRPTTSIARFLIQNEPTLKLDAFIVNLINYGLVKSPAELATPYLHIALVYLEMSRSAQNIEQVLESVAEGTKTIADSGGSEHLEFFRRARFVTNAIAFSGRPDSLKLMVLRTCHIWGIALLDYPDLYVTEKVSQFLSDLLFTADPYSEDDEELVDSLHLALGCIPLNIAKTSMLNFFGLSISALEAKSGSVFAPGAPDPTQLRALIIQVQELILPLDETTSNAYESDELTDVSSTFHTKGATADDPIEI